jgi:peroxiredoxin
MLKFYLFVCLVLFVSVKTSYGQKQYHYQVQGQISSLKGKVYLLKYGGGKIDSAIVSGGAFKMSGYINEPYLYALVQKTGDFISTFVLNNNKINIRGDYRKPDKLRVDGDNERQMDISWQRSVNKFDSLRDVTGKQKRGSHQDRALKEADIDKKEIEFVSRLIFANSDKFLSLLYLKMYYSRLGNKKRVDLYQSLSPVLKENSLAKIVRLQIQTDKIALLKIGIPAPGFAISDQYGHAISLASLRGNYVLLSFWASWCKPCRAEHPAIVKLYSQIKNKNFKIVFISLDKIKNDWLNAVKTDKLPGINLCDFKGFDSINSIQYKVSEIPYHVLIDPDGNLIATNNDAEILINRYIKK